MKRWLILHAAVVLIILCVALLPLASLVTAGVIANVNGCPLDEGSVHPCVINGVDYGETLLSMALLGGILMIFTIPLGLLFVMAYVVVVGIIYLVRRNRPDSTALT